MQSSLPRVLEMTGQTRGSTAQLEGLVCVLDKFKVAPEVGRTL